MTWMKCERFVHPALLTTTEKGENMAPCLQRKLTEEEKKLIQSEKPKIEGLAKRCDATITKWEVHDDCAVIAYKDLEGKEAAYTLYAIYGAGDSLIFRMQYGASYVERLSACLNLISKQLINTVPLKQSGEHCKS